MRSIHIYILAFIFLCLALLIYFIFKNPKDSEFTKLKLKDVNLQVKIADTTEKRTKGLMGRKSLEKNHGMLFVFPNTKKHTFWMFNTYISLDILWLDENYKVVDIYEDAKPCTESISSMCKLYTPEVAAKYVLEVNSGFVKEKSIKIGDLVEL